MIFSIVRRVANVFTGTYKHRKRANRIGWFFHDDITGRKVVLWHDPADRTVYLGTSRWGYWVTTALEPEMARHMANSHGREVLYE
jgi:hypothetical protein